MIYSIHLRHSPSADEWLFWHGFSFNASSTFVPLAVLGENKIIKATQAKDSISTYDEGRRWWNGGNFNWKRLSYLILRFLRHCCRQHISINKIICDFCNNFSREFASHFLSLFTRTIFHFQTFSLCDFLRWWMYVYTIVQCTQRDCLFFNLQLTATSSSNNLFIFF